MATWLSALRGDPRPWLLEDTTPAVKHLTLRLLLERPADDPEVRQARAAAMAAPPIGTILAAQQPEGYWMKPGSGYYSKYRGTVWQLIFLDQLGADGGDPRVQRACDYVLTHSQAETGGFGASGRVDQLRPPPSSVIHCLNCNLLRALLGFGRIDDERVQRAIDWQARSITGEHFDRYFQSGTSGPGFCCAANDKLPCAWGAIKVLLGLARIPPSRRAPHVERAIAQGVDFLLGCDPAVADYPMGWGNTRPNRSWFKPGFPSAYVTDVLQNLEVLCELGFGGDARLDHAHDWLLSKQGAPSKWVTLRACHVLKTMADAGGGGETVEPDRVVAR
jgi:hypothetical protein